MLEKNVDMVLGWGIVSRSLWAVVVVLMSLYAPLLANAKENQEKAVNQQQENHEFSESLGDSVSAALDLLVAQQFTQGISALETTLKTQIGSPHEISTIYQLLGSSYLNLKNYSAAIENFESAIDAGGLLPKEASNLQINIAQLLIRNEQFVRGAEMLEQWERDGGVMKPALLTMLYQAWLQAGEYEKALPWAKLWFDSANPKRRKHYDLMNYLYNILEMPAQQAAIVKQMINIWPEDKALWRAWGALLSEAGREQEAFDVMKMMYLKGLYRREPEIYRIVQYYSFYNMPYQAAEILEAEIKTGRIRDTEASQRMLERLWKQAREEGKAFSAFERVVLHLETVFGDKSSSEDLMILAKAKLKLGRCEEVHSLIDKLGPRSISMANTLNMLVGSCYYDTIDVTTKTKCLYNDEDKRQARETKWRLAKSSFRTVAQSETTSKNEHPKYAQKWVSFIDTEREALDNKCYAYSRPKYERCFIAIKQAYANMVFAGEFILKNEICQQYVSEYDSLYRAPKK